MDEFTDRFEFGIAGDLFFEEILDCFDVMIGGALDVLDALRVLYTEIVPDILEDFIGVADQCGHFGDVRVRGQRLQPAHFHQYAMTDQSVFAEDRSQ